MHLVLFILWVYYYLSSMKGTQIPVDSEDGATVASLVALSSNRNNNKLYQIRLCRPTICERSGSASAPCIALRSGIPRIKVLGNVERERPVMIQFNRPRELILASAVSTKRASSFWRKSANISFRFILYGLIPEITWNDNNGIENLATNLFMPAHWSGVKSFHHFTEMYANIMAKYNGTVAVTTW